MKAYQNGAKIDARIRTSKVSKSMKELTYQFPLAQLNLYIQLIPGKRSEFMSEICLSIEFFLVIE